MTLLGTGLKAPQKVFFWMAHNYDYLRIILSCMHYFPVTESEGNKTVYKSSSWDKLSIECSINY